MLDPMLGDYENINVCGNYMMIYHHSTTFVPIAAIMSGNDGNSTNLCPPAAERGRAGLLAVKARGRQHGVAQPASRSARER
jgi:hypothetical protein